MSRKQSVDVPNYEYFGQRSIDVEKPWQMGLANFSMHLIMSVAFFAVFVAFFFFVVVAWAEHRSVQENTNRVVTELMTDVKDIAPQEVQNDLRDSLHTLTVPDMAQIDADVAESNKNLVNNTLIVLGSAFGACMLAVLGIWAFMKWRAGRDGVSGEDYPDIKAVFMENLILLGFVAMVETVFLFLLAARYRTLDANKVRASVIGTIRQFINS